MAISLDAFRTIANGTLNLGEVALSRDGNSLEKVNNHVLKWSENGTQLTVAQNRATRNALMKALEGAGLEREVLFQCWETLIGHGHQDQALTRKGLKSFLGGLDKLVAQKALNARKVALANPNMSKVDAVMKSVSAFTAACKDPLTTLEEHRNVFANLLKSIYRVVGNRVSTAELGHMGHLYEQAVARKTHDTTDRRLFYGKQICWNKLKEIDSRSGTDFCKQLWAVEPDPLEARRAAAEDAWAFGLDLPDANHTRL